MQVRILLGAPPAFPRIQVRGSADKRTRSSMDRAPGYEPDGCGFNCCRVLQLAGWYPIAAPCIARDLGMQLGKTTSRTTNRWRRMAGWVGRRFPAQCGGPVTPARVSARAAHGAGGLPPSCRRTRHYQSNLNGVSVAAAAG